MPSHLAPESDSGYIAFALDAQYVREVGVPSAEHVNHVHAR